MIAIVNITENPKPRGTHTYSLRINKQEICQFTHKREDSLAQCLMAAAKAAEIADIKKWAILFGVEDIERKVSKKMADDPIIATPPGVPQKPAALKDAFLGRYSGRIGNSEDVDIIAGQDVPCEPCPSCGKSDWISDFDKFNHEAGCIRYR